MSRDIALQKSTEPLRRETKRHRPQILAGVARHLEMPEDFELCLEILENIWRQRASKEISSAAFSVIWGVLRGLVTGAYRFMLNIVRGVVLQVDLATTVRAAGEAAGESWSKAVEKITARRVAYAFAGAIAMVGVLLFLEYVLHRSYQNVYVYNLTDYDISFSIPYSDYGEMGNSATDFIHARTQQFSGDVPLGSWYKGAAFRYQSASDFHGLGYVLKLNLQRKDSPEVVKTFTCMFDVPFTGGNSLAATVAPVSNYIDYYRNNEGVNTVTQFSASDDTHEIIVTYDYLDGQHEDPETGQQLYLYSSLVILRDRVASV